MGSICLAEAGNPEPNPAPQPSPLGVGVGLGEGSLSQAGTWAPTALPRPRAMPRPGSSRQNEQQQGTLSCTHSVPCQRPVSTWPIQPGAPGSYPGLEPDPRSSILGPRAGQPCWTTSRAPPAAAPGVAGKGKEQEDRTTSLCDKGFDPISAAHTASSGCQGLCPLASWQLCSHSLAVPIFPRSSTSRASPWPQKQACGGHSRVCCGPQGGHTAPAPVPAQAC